ncbi:MAG: TRAP transporter small permease, partial [Eubacteriales bacterium]|nr:TRAP transporter small permease [Eubacteriales bacterium]
MSRLENTAFWNGLAKVLRFVMIITSVLVTLIVFGSVILRELNLNFLGYEEILIIVAFWLYMIGAAYGSYEKSHITADIIVVMMPESMIKSLFALIRNTLTVVLGIIFLIWAYELVQWTIEMNTRTPVWRIPVTVGQSSILVGLFISSFYHLVYLYDEAKKFVEKYIKKTIAID